MLVPPALCLRRNRRDTVPHGGSGADQRWRPRGGLPHGAVQAPIRVQPRHRAGPVTSDARNMSNEGAAVTTSSAPTEIPRPARAVDEPLLQVTGLQKHFPINRGIIFKKKVGAV